MLHLPVSKASNACLIPSKQTPFLCLLLKIRGLIYSPIFGCRPRQVNLVFLKRKKKNVLCSAICFQAGQTWRQTNGWFRTDRWGWGGVCVEEVGGVDRPPQLKPGQQRTRVMLAYSSPTASLDGGKDGGRRVREQGSRGETKSGGEGR